MFKILLTPLTNRQYNTLDLMVFMLFAGYAATERLWTASFVFIAGSLISALIDVAVRDYLKPEPSPSLEEEFEPIFQAVYAIYATPAERFANDTAWAFSMLHTATTAFPFAQAFQARLKKSVTK